jgi:hypothetical protein
MPTETILFDPAAARAWLTELLPPDTYHPRTEPRAADYGIDLEAAYTGADDDNRPADWLDQLIADLDHQAAPHVWQAAAGVSVEVVETVGSEARPVGGAVLIVELAGAIRLASHWLEATDLVSYSYGDPPRPYLDAVVEALATAAQTINAMVHRDRDAQPAVNRPGTEPVDNPGDDPILALYRAVDDAEVDWLDAVMVKAGLMWEHDPNDDSCGGMMNRMTERVCGNCGQARVPG